MHGFVYLIHSSGSVGSLHEIRLFSPATVLIRSSNWVSSLEGHRWFTPAIALVYSSYQQPRWGNALVRWNTYFGTLCNCSSLLELLRSLTRENTLFTSATRLVHYSNHVGSLKRLHWFNLSTSLVRSSASFGSLQELRRFTPATGSIFSNACVGLL